MSCFSALLGFKLQQAQVFEIFTVEVTDFDITPTGPILYVTDDLT